MEKRHLDRILDAIIDQKIEQFLGVYVELELAGQDAAAQYPDIAHHLKICTACYEEYSSLREIMQQDFEAEDFTPETSASISSQPSPSLAERVQQFAAWKRAFIDTSSPAPHSEQHSAWQLYLERSSKQLLRVRSLDIFEPPQIDAPLRIAELDTNLKFAVEAADDMQSLDGQFSRLDWDWIGAKVYLYTLAPPARMHETVIGDLGEFRFEQVAVGMYVLTVDLPTGEIPIAMLEISSGKP